MAQPDFDTLTASMTNTANGLRNAAAEMDNATTEISKIQHIAAADIVRQLARMQQQLDRIERGQQDMLQRFARSENNNLARMFNSRVADETHRLEPLYDVNNEIIEDFPQTSANINHLNVASVNNLLGQLGLPVNGSLEAKKKRIRRYVGLMVI